jgi:hypothetical protein
VQGQVQEVGQLKGRFLTVFGTNAGAGRIYMGTWGQLTVEPSPILGWPAGAVHGRPVKSRDLTEL